MGAKEVIIDGILYVPKESVKEDNSTPPFKVGDWVTGLQFNWDVCYRIEKISNQDKVVVEAGEFSEGIRTYPLSALRLATHSEIETYLITEAERRGFKPGQNLHKLNGFYSDVIRSEYPRRFEYKEDLDRLEMNGTGIYEKGRWAEIIKEPRPLPKTVDELDKILQDFMDECERYDSLPIQDYKDIFIQQFR